MNLLYPYSWVKDFLDLELSAKEFAKEVSLCGSSVAKIIPKKDGDFVFDVEITTNRPDIIGVRGFARDAYAITQQFGHFPKLEYPKEKTIEIKQPIKHKLEINTDPNLCPKFCAVVIDNVQIEDSPAILKERLEKAGIRSLNNVIDITNYVMLEYGQPMHAFDFSKISPNNIAKMNIRASKKGECLTTLDKQNRTLPENSIVIDDGKEIYDLAGIMGGLNSEIDKNTKTIILISQIYNPKNVRHSSLRLNHRTLAAQIFEKGIDPQSIVPALKKAIELVIKYTNGVVSSELYNIDNMESSVPYVRLTAGKLNIYMGREIHFDTTIKILGHLGIQTKYNPNEKVYVCEIPSWRKYDISIEEDIIEEVARIYGYFNLKPKIIPTAVPDTILDSKFQKEHQVKKVLQNLGYSEVYTYSLVADDQLGKGGLKLRNPLTKDKQYLRNCSLIPSLNQIIAENKGRASQIGIFEIANLYIKKDEKDTLPEESLNLALLNYKEESWEGYLEIKGLLETILITLGINPETLEYSDPPNLRWNEFFDKKQATAMVEPSKKEKVVAIVGKVNSNTWGFQLDLDYAMTLPSKEKKFKPYNTHSPVKEDISFVVSANTSFWEIRNALKNVQLPPNDTFVYTLREVYSDNKLKAHNSKSLMFSFEFNSEDKQLTEKDSLRLRNIIEQKLQKELNAQIRAA